MLVAIRIMIRISIAIRGQRMRRATLLMVFDRRLPADPRRRMGHGKTTILVNPNRDSPATTTAPAPSKPTTDRAAIRRPRPDLFRLHHRSRPLRQGKQRVCRSHLAAFAALSRKVVRLPRVLFPPVPFVFETAPANPVAA